MTRNLRDSKGLLSNSVNCLSDKYKKDNGKMGDIAALSCFKEEMFFRIEKDNVEIA